MAGWVFPLSSCHFNKKSQDGYNKIFLQQVHSKYTWHWLKTWNLIQRIGFMAVFCSYRGEKFWVWRNRIISSYLISQETPSFYFRKGRRSLWLKAEWRPLVLSKAKKFQLLRKPSYDKELQSKSHKKLSLSILAQVQHWANTLKPWDKIQKLIVCFAHYWLTFPQDLSLSHKHTQAPSTRWCEPTQGCIYHLSDTRTTFSDCMKLGPSKREYWPVALHCFQMAQLSPKHRKPCICSTAGNLPELV